MGETTLSSTVGFGTAAIAMLWLSQLLTPDTPVWELCLPMPLFGVSNDNVPNKLYVSPRMGFSWSYGQAAAIAGFAGAARGPRAVVRGGIGLFQNTPSVNQIGFDSYDLIARRLVAQADERRRLAGEV